MTKRAGSTRNVSISLGPDAHRVLRRRAKSVHGGNLSAAVAEAAELLRRDMALAELVSELESEHGPLTDEKRERIDAEWRGPSRRKKTRAA